MKNSGKVIRVAESLRNDFGRPKYIKEKDAVGGLVRTILSQNTADVNSFRAYDNLKRHFRGWEALRRAPISAIKKEIKVAGLSSIKAARLKEVLNEITRRRGSLNLGFIGGLDTRAGYEFLRSLKGVGPKTAAIVLLFSFGKPIMPVDTHIYRVAGRLGLIDAKMTREAAQEYLTSITPKGTIYEFHINLIEHGRKICIARNPRCGICSLKKLCKYYRDGSGAKARPVPKVSLFS